MQFSCSIVVQNLRKRYRMPVVEILAFSFGRMILCYPVKPRVGDILECGHVRFMAKTTDIDPDSRSVRCIKLRCCFRIHFENALLFSGFWRSCWSATIQGLQFKSANCLCVSAWINPGDVVQTCLSSVLDWKQLITTLEMRFRTHTLWDIRLKTSLLWRLYLLFALITEKAGDIKLCSRWDVHVDNSISIAIFGNEASNLSNYFTVLLISRNLGEARSATLTVSTARFSF